MPAIQNHLVELTFAHSNAVKFFLIFVKNFMQSWPKKEYQIGWIHIIIL